MYCCYDESKEKIIALHDEYKIIKSYCDTIKKQHDIELKIAKIKNKKIKKITDYDDLYLVRYGDCYIQSGYLEYMDITTGQYIYDNTYCKDVLMRILELYDLSNSEIKNIKKTIKLIDKILKEDSEYTPLFSDLEKMKLDYEPYMYNKEIWNEVDNDVKK